MWDEAQLARCELIDKLADLDTPLAEYVLEQESLEGVPPPLMKEAVRRATLSQASPSCLPSGILCFDGNSMLRWICHAPVGDAHQKKLRRLRIEGISEVIRTCRY